MPPATHLANARSAQQIPINTNYNNNTSSNTKNMGGSAYGGTLMGGSQGFGAPPKNSNKSPIKERQGPPATVTPGPGHYSHPDLNRWFKRSYNMNFSEV